MGLPLKKSLTSEIKFDYKKGFVTVKKQQVLKLKHSAGYFYIYDLMSDKEIMYIHKNDNETPQYFGDDYVKVFFTDSEKSSESKLHYRIIMERLIIDEVIDSDWHLNEEDIDKFITRYDEDITSRTLRNN